MTVADVSSSGNLCGLGDATDPSSEGCLLSLSECCEEVTFCALDP